VNEQEEQSRYYRINMQPNSQQQFQLKFQAEVPRRV